MGKGGAKDGRLSLGKGTYCSSGSTLIVNCPIDCASYRDPGGVRRSAGPAKDFQPKRRLDTRITISQTGEMRFILAPCFKLKAEFGSRSRGPFFAWRSTCLNVRSTDRQSRGASVLLGRVRGAHTDERVGEDGTGGSFCVAGPCCAFWLRGSKRKRLPGIGAQPGWSRWMWWSPTLTTSQCADSPAGIVGRTIFRTFRDCCIDLILRRFAATTVLATTRMVTRTRQRTRHTESVSG